jgi:hypothetical protein
MAKENLENKGRQYSTPKRCYVSPVLVRYGQVRDLTQAGTGAVKEAKFKGVCIGIRPDRKSCYSDWRAKENLVRIGDHPLGIGLYLFDYKPEFRDEWGHGRQFGVLAQEVETVLPEAVCTHPDGYRMVDYAMLGIRRDGHH